MPFAECSALLPRSAAFDISSPQRIFRSSLSASIHLNHSRKRHFDTFKHADLLRVSAGVLR